MVLVYADTVVVVVIMSTCTCMCFLFCRTSHKEFMSDLYHKIDLPLKGLLIAYSLYATDPCVCVMLMCV